MYCPAEDPCQSESFYICLHGSHLLYSKSKQTWKQHSFCFESQHGAGWRAGLYVRDSYISRQPHLSLFIRTGSSSFFLLLHTEKRRKTSTWVITYSCTCGEPRKMRVPPMTKEKWTVWCIFMEKIRLLMLKETAQTHLIMRDTWS